MDQSPETPSQTGVDAAKESPQTRVILIGVGGATCSGKTTLAKHLNKILPDSVIIHQDDFAPPQELVPVHPVHQVQDWDAAPGAISWPRLISFLRHVKESGELPEDHRSHDHLNKQKAVPVAEEVADRLRAEFIALQEQIVKEKGQKIVCGLVDGFLLYWNRDVFDQLDVKFFLRVPHDVLKHRRHERHGYHTAEGSLWRDPPDYWENIVYPAYIDAHRDAFVNGDIEHGQPNDKVPDLQLLEMTGLSMEEAVERCCGELRGAMGKMGSRDR
ncbi:hypothetical protein HGRIS_002367 [Hohenbuehelia grisea]|uniref:P-loop containing nucleoside triphosphate hydrolase protein n=1 Tax=Hohenbuehelia grisea TaxID=104357 RepID=A0ABR3JK97_9AGAR